MVLAPAVARAATTLAGTCIGARRRDFLLGIRRGQPAGAQVQRWCSWHECTNGCSRQAGPHGQLTHATDRAPPRYRCTDAGEQTVLAPPGAECQATRMETGFTTRIMRLSTSAAMAASPCWAGRVRARSFGPMIALYLPARVSARLP